MHLARLEVHNLRIVAEATLDLASGINVFVGPNGSGKTSLLEAIHLLGSGRSFRSHRLSEVTRTGASVLRVRGEVCEGDTRTSVGLERGTEGLRIRAGGEEVRSASDLARRLPMVVITPDSQRLLGDGAPLRRQLIDWPLFHVEPSYLDVLQRYRRALRQRNSALRNAAGSQELDSWDQELGQSGEAVHGLRERHLEAILPAFSRTVSELLSIPVAIRYRPGWSREVSLVEALTASVGTDLGRGFTGVGPHRADLRFSVEGTAAHQVLSRGEGKLFVAGLLLAQGMYLAGSQGRAPMVLVDDLASELDADSRGRFLALLQSLGSQILVTTVSRELLELRDWETVRVFHVERGKATKMV
jgi:DNA replication and repair protein RecF